MTHTTRSRRFINPLTDVGFKRLFGQDENKGLLIAFLNCLFKGKPIISDLTYNDKEILPIEDEGKTVIFDIHCTTSTGEHIVVEMQCEPQAYFNQRSLLYASSAYVRQTQKGKDWIYTRLQPVYVISFLDFKLKEYPAKLITRSSIRDDEGEHATINPYMRFIYIQLPFCLRHWRIAGIILKSGFTS